MIVGDLADRLDRAGGVGLDRLDPARDVLGRPRGLLRQLLDLVGDDREALAGLAGAGGLDGRVERQQVGLLGDRGDHLDHVADLLATTSPSLATVSLVGSAMRDGLRRRPGRPRWPSCAISRIEAPISSAPAATVCTLRDTSSAAAETTPACAEVSSAPAAICCDDADSSSDAAASASADSDDGRRSARAGCRWRRRGSRPSGRPRPGWRGRSSGSGRPRPARRPPCGPGRRRRRSGARRAGRSRGRR